MDAMFFPPKGSGTCQKEEAERSEELEVVDDFQEMVFSRCNKAAAHTNSLRV